MAPVAMSQKPLAPANATRFIVGWMRAPGQRRLALYAVKAGHTLVFLVVGAGVLETLRAGLRGHTSRATGPAIAATIGEGLVLLANKNRCPLTDLAEALGAADGRVSDIFLPPWFARHIPSICTAMFGFGLGRLIEAQSRYSARQSSS